jgi:katanin p60 ATPase-containing subunit A1
MLQRYCFLFRHLTTLDDPLIRTKWMNLKKSLSEETQAVKELDAERRALKEAPASRRVASPPIHPKSSFLFQPLDEYPSPSAAPIDDPDVWRPPSRDTASRRPARSAQAGIRKSPQDGVWARGASTRTSTTGRGAKTGGSGRVNSGVRASTTGKRGTSTSTVTGKPGKGDSAVSSLIRGSRSICNILHYLLHRKKERLFTGRFLHLEFADSFPYDVVL